MARSPRLSVGRLSVCLEDSHLPLVDEMDGDGDVDSVISSDGRRASVSAAVHDDNDDDVRRPRFLSMSRVKQLTVASFSLSNLGVGCFFSILGPFFPNAVHCITISRTR